MAAPTKTRPTPKAKPGPKAAPKKAQPKAAAAKPAAAKAKPAAGEPKAAAKPKTRNQRPKLEVFWEDTDVGTLTSLGKFLGNDAEDAFNSYLGSLDDEEKAQAYEAVDYAVATLDEGIVRLEVIPPSEPTIQRK